MKVIRDTEINSVSKFSKGKTANEGKLKFRLMQHEKFLRLI